MLRCRMLQLRYFRAHVGCVLRSGILAALPLPDKGSGRSIGPNGSTGRAIWKEGYCRSAGCFMWNGGNGVGCIRETDIWP